MWNNGEDIYEKMNNVKEQGSPRFPFIEPGRHKLVLVTLERFPHRTAGIAVRALFKVLESTAHQIGTYVVRILKINERSKLDGSFPDAEQLAYLCIALKNAPRGYLIGQDIRVLLEEREADQPARGTLVECNASRNKKDTWTNLYWSHVPQTAADIVAMRQKLELEGIPSTGATAQMAARPASPQNPYTQTTVSVGPAVPVATAPAGGFLANATGGGPGKW